MFNSRELLDLYDMSIDHKLPIKGAIEKLILSHLQDMQNHRDSKIAKSAEVPIKDIGADKDGIKAI